MPEGPEVANLAEELNFYLTDRTVIGIDILGGPMSRHGIPEGVERLKKSLPLTVREVEYRGKLIIFKIDGWWAFSTLGMSGGWYLHHRKHSHIRLRLQPEGEGPLYPDEIYFSDPRCFGTFDATDRESVYLERRDRIRPGFLGKYRLSLEEWKKNVNKHRKKNICKSLMDQTLIIGGIGNYLLSEILHRAGVSPWIKWSDLSNEKIESLYEVSEKTITHSYDTRGASIENYRSMTGEEGESTFYFMVYGQEEDEEGNEVVSVTGPHGRTLWISSKYPWTKP